MTRDMTRTRSLLLAACLAALPAGTAMAQRVSTLPGGRFLEICARPQGAAVCDAYIAGLADSVALTHVYDRHQGDANAPTGFCIPAGTPTQDMRGRVVSWLRGHSAQLSSPVGGLVFTALHDAYPCGGGK